MNMFFFISVACASVLITSASADFTGSVCSGGIECVIDTDKSGNIINDDKNQAKLTIKQGVTLTGEVENQGNLSINNSGIISKNAGGAVLSNGNRNIELEFINQKNAEIIGGGGVEIGSKNSNIGGSVSLVNYGTIRGTTAAIPDNQSVDAFGVSIVGGDAGGKTINVGIKNFGLIQSQEYGMNFVGNNSKILISEIQNSGTISATATNSNDGIHLGKNVEAEMIYNAKAGKISGKFAIWMADNANLKEFINEGEIKGYDRGIVVAGKSTINLLDNTGTIEGEGKAGIQIQGDTKINILKSSGKISGKDNGILIEAAGNGKAWGELGKLELDGNAEISSVMNDGKVGEVLLGDNAKIPDFKNTGEVGIISVKDSANIASLTNSGTIKALETQAQGTIGILTNEANAVIENLAIANKINQFTNNGIITTITNSAGLDKFENIGNIDNFVNKDIVGDFKNTKDLKSFVNIGTLENGIQNDGGKIERVENTGVIKTNNNGIHLFNNNTKDIIKIEKWYVKSAQKITLKEHENLGNVGNDGDSRIILGGDGASVVDFSDATLLIDANQYQKNVYFKVDNVVLLKEQGNLTSANATPKDIVDKSGTRTFNVIYNPQAGTFIIDPLATAMAGGFFADYLVNYLQRRNISMNQLIRYEEEKMHSKPTDVAHIFVVPYYAYDDFDLSSRNGNAEISTNGIVTGWHYFSDYGIIGGFLGYEDSNGDINITDSNAYRDVAGDVKGVFAGLRYKRYFYENGSHKISWNNQVKFGSYKADMHKIVNDKYFQDSAKVWNYAVESIINYDYSLQSDYGESILSLGAGVKYDGLRVDAFELQTKSQKRSENFYGADVTLRALHKIGNISGVLEVGMYRLFNSEIKARYGEDEDSFKVPDNYRFLQTGLIYDVNENIYFSLNYSALFADNGASHLGSLAFNVKW